MCGGQCIEVCAPPKVVLDPETCNCECPPDEACTSTGGTVNPNTCQCECPAGKVLCQGQCFTSCDTTIGEVLTPDTCQCECASGLTRCGNRCVNTATDPNTCGSCNNACPSGQGCVDGTCRNFCPNQMTGCCACFYTDPTTGHRIYTCTGATVGSCITRAQCEARCQATTPPPGYVHGGVVHNCENATSTQPVFCNAFGPDPRFAGVTCGHQACAATGSQCPSGQTPCGGQCVNVSTDPNNCGSCNNACPTGASCVSGKCGCPTGTTLCNGSCVSTTCPITGQIFNPTTCRCECPTDTELCGGECVSNVCDSTTGDVFNPATCQCRPPHASLLASVLWN